MAEPVLDLAIEKIVRRYRDLGYQVQIQPETRELPFDVKGYRPEILASKGEELLIFDIKTSDQVRDHALYNELTEVVTRHKGWDFLISTIPAYSQEEPTEPIETPTREEIEQLLNELESLVNSENFELAIPRMWHAIAGGLRIVASENKIPAGYASDLRVLNDMYSLAFISCSQYMTSKSFLERTHSHAFHPTQKDLEEFLDFVRGCLDEWRITSPVMV